MPLPDTLNYHRLTRRCQRHDRLSPYLILFRARHVQAVFLALKHVPRYLARPLATAGRTLRWKGSSQNFVFSRLALSCGTYNLFAMDTHLSSQQLCFHVPNSSHLLLDTHIFRDVIIPRVGHSFIFPTALFHVPNSVFTACWTTTPQSRHSHHAKLLLFDQGLPHHIY